MLPLQTTFGENTDTAMLLSQMQLTVARNGTVVALPDGSQLDITLAPTPRWPDLMMGYHAPSKLLFTSKMFSAHVLPSLVSQDVSITVAFPCRAGAAWPL